MCNIDFTSLHPHEGAGHVVTNEDPRIHSSLLRRSKAKRLSRVASICSGGEIIFFNLLPRTTEMLVAVDHSQKAITSAILKALMLSELGVKETKKILTSNDISRVNAAAEQVLPLVPEALRPFVLGEKTKDPEEIAKKIGIRVDQFALYGYQHYLTDGYPIKSKCIDQSYISDIAKLWSLASIRALSISRKKIQAGLIKFVHGDLRDISSMGPFDLFYASNAREHTPRDNTDLYKASSRGNIPPDAFENLIKPSGFLLETGSASYPPNKERWRPILKGQDKEIRRDPTVSPLTIMGWNYAAWQRKDEQIEAVV